MIRQRKLDTVSKPRRGIAAVEFAVCVPVLIILFLGSIECANMIYLKQTLKLSSYEGVRKAIQYNGTNQSARDRCENILTARHIQQAQIEFTPSNVATVSPGTEISVTISAPCDVNSSLPLTIFANHEMSVTTKMVKE